MLRTIMMIFALLPASTPAKAIVEEPRPSPSHDAQERCDSLFEAFSEEYQRYIDGTHAAKTDEEARCFTPPDGTAYAMRLMEIAREHPDGPVAVDALTRAMIVDYGGPYWREAIAIFEANHVDSQRIGQALELIARDTRPPSVEPFLRDVLRRNPSAEVQAHAALGLAMHLRRLAEEVEHLRRHPDRFERVASEFGREDSEQFRDRDPSALRLEHESLLERVVTEYADIVPRQSVGILNAQVPSPAERAEDLLFELRELAIGKVAPEIEGEDLDGLPMSLSDFRGKVVVLSWWATWCGPCMEMVPHELDLIDRMQGQPFVLLGINGDEDPGRMKHQMSERGITWRSWADDGPSGPISTRWNVKAWPTVYVIDADGVIRYKGHRETETLDLAVESLLRAQDGSGSQRD